MAHTPTLNDMLAGNVPLTPNHAEIKALAALRQSRVLTLVLAPGMQLKTSFIPPLVEVLDTLPEGGSLDLFVPSLGGASEETWRIVSILRERFDRYTAVVPFAASAGATQVALGADDLLMGEASSLAPLEPARLRELRSKSGDAVPINAYDVHHYLRFLRRELGLDHIAPESPVHEHLWSRIDPLVIGATEKAHQLNRLVTRRCLETHLDPERDREQIERILDEVSTGLLSSRFPITRRDCEGRLGLGVLKPTRDLWSAVWDLQTYYDTMIGLEGDLILGDKQHYTVGYAGFIDTANNRRVLLRITRVDEHGRPMPDVTTLYRWVRPSQRSVVVNEELEL